MRGRAEVEILKDSDIPIHKQLEDLIVSKIRNGELKPGDRIHSEPNVARKYGISRSTVRSVYDRLVLKNLLLRRPGKGTFVSFPVTTGNASLLVGFSKSMNNVGILPTTKMLSRQVIEATDEVLEKLNLESEKNVIEIRRIRFIKEIPFVLHTAYLPFDTCQAALEADLENIGLTSYIEVVLGIEICRAEQTILALPAQKEEANLLEIKRGFPTLVVKGISYDIEDIPIRYSVSTYRSDITRLRATSEKPIKNINA